MRCLKLDWLNVKSLEELKRLGNFNEIRAEIKNFGGKTIHVSGRSWGELLESIKDFKDVINKLNLSDSQDVVVEVTPSKSNVFVTSNSDYFIDRASEYIFYLTQLDGESRMSKLGITPAYFSSQQKARKWRDKISKVIHPDVCKHVHASDAMAQLNDLYNQMVGRE